MNPYSHLGKGYKYPFRMHNGSVEQAQFVASINSSIHLILDTKPGELFMSPHIGCRLWELVFMPIDEVFFALATEYITQALYDQEPRIDSLRIAFRDPEDPNDRNKVIIAISYDVANMNYSGETTYEFIGMEATA